MIYKLALEKQAVKDLVFIKRIGLDNSVFQMLKIISNNPFQNPPPYKKLKGYSNRYSRRINIQHRLVYEIDNYEIKILSMWSHYE